MIPRVTILTLFALGFGVACAPAAGPAGTVDQAEVLPTRPERTGFAETSPHADVLEFIRQLETLDPPITVGTLGRTTEGRELPYVIASRPRVANPDEARRLGRPIVYVQGNIHGGEVEGKEALQMILRDLTLDPRPNPLDSIVLIAVPIYNADGNDRFGPQSENREEQHGPERIGVRANGQGLDLNRDYMKAVTPETQGSLAMFVRWDPDVFVDLHATNGSYHGYALTYAPPLSPAAGAAGRFTRDELLPELRRRMRDRHGYETFDYGNFSREYGADVTPDTVRDGWFSFDHRPRFATNYYGLRGRVAILSEAYSHDPFERRIASTYTFVREILSLAAERRADLSALRETDPLAALGGRVPIRAELTRSPYRGEVIMEVLEADPDSVPAEPGVHPGIRRTGRFRTLTIPIHDRFDPTLLREAPAAYLVPPSQVEVIRLLQEHGVRLDTFSEAADLHVESFVIDSVYRASWVFQGHHETRLEGRWRAGSRSVPAGTVRVPMDQTLAVLAAYLLEPESDDGIAAWSSPAASAPGRRFFAAELVAGMEYPVLREIAVAVAAGYITNP